MPGSEWLQYGAFGVMFFILVSVGTFLWAAWKWFTKKIAEPFIHQHNRMIESQIEMQQKTAQFMSAMERHAKTEERFQQQLADTQTKMHETLMTLSGLAPAKA